MDTACVLTSDAKPMPARTSSISLLQTMLQRTMSLILQFMPS